MSVLVAKRGRAQVRGFATDVGAKADIGAPPRTQLSFMRARPNGAQVLFLADGAVSQRLDDCELCAVPFDGNDEAALTAAREQWRGLKGR